MVKKFIILFLIVVLLSGGTALAKEANLPNPGILPDSPFYFLKIWGEEIVILFTFNDIAKAERFVARAEKRLAEAKALIEKGKLDLAQEILVKYEEHLEKALTRAQKAKEKGLNAEEVLVRVSEATLKHQAVLSRVYEQVPDQAKAAIKRAMEAGMRGHEEAIKALSGEKRKEIQEKIESKKQDAKRKPEKAKKEKQPAPQATGGGDREDGSSGGEEAPSKSKSLESPDKPAGLEYSSPARPIRPQK